MLCKELFHGPWNSQNNQNSTKDLSQEEVEKPVQKTEEKADTWKCECGHENIATAKFCNECGKPRKVSSVCSKCGFENPEGAKFCNNCGEKL